MKKFKWYYLSDKELDNNEYIIDNYYWLRIHNSLSTLSYIIKRSILKNWILKIDNEKCYIYKVEIISTNNIFNDFFSINSDFHYEIESLYCKSSNNLKIIWKLDKNELKIFEFMLEKYKHSNKYIDYENQGKLLDKLKEIL